MIEYLMVCFISGEWIIIIIISGVFHIFFPPLYFFLLIKKKKLHSKKFPITNMHIQTITYLLKEPLE